jgi:hypothetical protein
MDNDFWFSYTYSKRKITFARGESISFDFRHEWCSCCYKWRSN